MSYDFYTVTDGSSYLILYSYTNLINISWSWLPEWLQWMAPALEFGNNCWMQPIILTAGPTTDLTAAHAKLSELQGNYGLFVGVNMG